MEQAAIIALVVAVAVIIIVITSCCCCCNSRKKKKEKQKQRAKKIASERKKHEEAPKKPNEGTSNEAFQESKPTDTLEDDKIEKKNDEPAIQPPDDTQPVQKVDNYNQTVNSQASVESEKIPVLPVQNAEEIKELQQRQEIDLGDPSPVFAHSTSLSSVSDKPDESVRLRSAEQNQELQRDSTTSDHFRSDSYKSSPYVAPYSREVREELGSFIQMSTSDKPDRRGGYENDRPMYPMPQSTFERLPRASSFNRQTNSNELPPAYHEPQRHRNHFRIERDVPVQLHVPVQQQHSHEKAPRVPSIPRPDYLEDTKPQTNLYPKPSNLKRREYITERQSLNEPPIVPPKPSAIKRREFKGPYGPEDLDEQNNPYTIARGKAKRYPINPELE